MADLTPPRRGRSGGITGTARATNSPATVNEEVREGREHPSGPWRDDQTGRSYEVRAPRPQRVGERDACAAAAAPRRTKRLLAESTGAGATAGGRPTRRSRFQRVPVPGPVTVAAGRPRWGGQPWASVRRGRGSAVLQAARHRPGLGGTSRWCAWSSCNRQLLHMTPIGSSRPSLRARARTVPGCPRGRRRACHGPAARRAAEPGAVARRRGCRARRRGRSAGAGPRPESRDTGRIGCPWR